MVIHCPKCDAELELPDDAVWRKVQCICCDEKFYVTNEFVRTQQELTSRRRRMA